MKLKLILVLIISLSIFSRFYRFPELFHWTLDQDYWAYLPFNIATAYHFQLIGGHIAGTGLYSGPSFIYLMAIPAKIFSGNPLGFGYTVAAVGVLGTILVYRIGRDMFGKTAGIFSAIIHSGSFLVAIYDREYWNASLTPILSLITIWLVWKVSQGKVKYVIFLAFVLTLAFHAHGTGMALIVFTIISWIAFKLPVRNKFVGLAIGLFLLFQLPLLIFELRHNYTNLRAASKFFSSSEVSNLPVYQKLTNIVSGFAWTSSRLIYFPASDLMIEQTLAIPSELAVKRGQPSAVAYLVVALVFVWSIKKVRNERTVAFPLLLIGSTFLGLLIYKTKFEEYFYLPTFLPLVLLLGSALGQLWQNKIGKTLVFCFLGLFLMGNIHNLLTVEHSFGFDARMKAIEESIVKVAGEPFVVDVQCRGYCQIYGLRYFYSFLGVEPVRTYSDGILGWLYDKKLPNKEPKKLIVFELNGKNITPLVTDINRNDP